MKYKLLLTGKNNAIIDDFFYAMFEEFECMTTSSRPRDIAAHIQLFRPDAIVCCLGKESANSDSKQIDTLKSAERGRIPMVLIGDSEACADFIKINPYIVNLVLEKPLSAKNIQDEMIKFLQDRKEQEELVSAQQNMQEMEVLPQEEDKKKTIKHILVIDDDPIMLRVIKEELKEKYNVATAVSGKIGLSFLQRKKTDLILLDYEMPGENGLEVLDKLRGNNETKDIPVIFLTGINDKERISKVLSKKPQGYLLKPIDHIKLIEEIQRVLE